MLSAFTKKYVYLFVTGGQIKQYENDSTCNETFILSLDIYLIIRRCARTGAFPGAFCVPNSVALASPTLWGVQWAIH